MYPPIAAAVQRHITLGGRVESQTPDMAVIVYGRRVHPLGHVIHAILTILTLGLWLIVWLIHDLAQRERRVILTVDSGGTVHETERKEPRSLVEKRRARKRAGQSS